MVVCCAATLAWRATAVSLLWLWGAFKKFVGRLCQLAMSLHTLVQGDSSHKVAFTFQKYHHLLVYHKNRVLHDVGLWTVVKIWIKLHGCYGLLDYIMCFILVIVSDMRDNITSQPGRSEYWINDVWVSCKKSSQKFTYHYHFSSLT